MIAMIHPDVARKAGPAFLEYWNIWRLTGNSPDLSVKVSTVAKYTGKSEGQNRRMIRRLEADGLVDRSGGLVALAIGAHSADVSTVRVHTPANYARV